MIYFNSWSFMLFLLIVFLIYWLLPQKNRNALLLVASYIFYSSWNWRFLSLILICTLTGYICGKLIYKAKSHRLKKIGLIIGVSINLTLLGFFKYYNFFISQVLDFLGTIGLSLNISTISILLPVGISFYTFQTISYAIDIYRGKIKPTNEFIDFALFVAYFPQLIAGPIERAQRLIPIIKEKKHVMEINYKKGLYLFFYGWLIKTIFADNMAKIVDSIFLMQTPLGEQVLIAILAYSVQIYCDFKGYSDMARGISEFFGIELSRNFKWPYNSKNPSEFWKRWHITLSSWVKDYIYIPLGGNQGKFYGLIPLFITMSLMGLWHGAKWNFVIWGVYFSVITLIYRIFKDRLTNDIPEIYQKIIMIILIGYSWLIFRSPSINQLLNLTTILMLKTNLLNIFHPYYFSVFVVIGFLWIYETYARKKDSELFLIEKMNFYHRLVFIISIVILIMHSGDIPNYTFIYFQF